MRLCRSWAGDRCPFPRKCYCRNTMKALLIQCRIFPSHSTFFGDWTLSFLILVSPSFFQLSTSTRPQSIATFTLPPFLMVRLLKQNPSRQLNLIEMQASTSGWHGSLLFSFMWVSTWHGRLSVDWVLVQSLGVWVSYVPYYTWFWIACWRLPKALIIALGSVFAGLGCWGGLV